MEPIEFNKDAFPLYTKTDSTFVDYYFDDRPDKQVDAEYIKYMTIGADCWAFGTSQSSDVSIDKITMFYDSYSEPTKPAGNTNRNWVIQHPEEFLDSLRQSKSYLHIWMFYKDGYKLIIDFTGPSLTMKECVKILNRA